jgi:hypothetical protein
MTFAHELQHFIQNGNQCGLWTASTLLMNLRPEFYRPSGL